MEELKALKVIYDEYRDSGVNVLGISIDNIELVGEKEIKEFTDLLGLNFTNIIADENFFVRLLEYIEGTPTTFVVGKEGELLIEPKVGSGGVENDIRYFRNIIKGIRSI